MQKLMELYIFIEKKLIFFYGSIGIIIKILFGNLDRIFLANGRIKNTIKLFIITGMAIGVLKTIHFLVINVDLKINNLFINLKNIYLFFELIGLVILSGIIGIAISMIIFTSLYLLIKVSIDNHTNVFIITFGILIIYSILVVVFELKLNNFFIISISLAGYLAAVVDLIKDNIERNSPLYKLRNFPLYVVTVLSLYLLIKNPEEFSIGFIDFQEIDMNAIGLGSIALIFASIGAKKMNGS